MEHQSPKAILVVSFGTSYEASRKATIEKIEQDIADAFPDYRIYHAWTSKFIISVLKKRDGISIPTVCEAIEQMIHDGIRTLIVQPTHILDGIENNVMKEAVLSHKDSFDQIAFGAPLLATPDDETHAIAAVTSEFKNLKKTDALVLMGHGTTHQINTTYSELDRHFKSLGHSNVFIGTVEADPTIHDLVKEVTEFHPTAIYLTPFMIVAGDHAHHDMAGDSPDSWVGQFHVAGFEVCPVIKGLGEYTGIRAIFMDHIKKAISMLH